MRMLWILGNKISNSNGTIIYMMEINLLYRICSNNNMIWLSINNATIIPNYTEFMIMKIHSSNNNIKE